MNRNITVLLFDLDGVIIHSEALHARAKKTTLERYRIAYPEWLFDAYKGSPDLTFWQYVSGKLCGGRYTTEELDACKRKVYFGLVNELEAIPGVFDFLAWARGHFLKLGLVSSATLADLDLSDRKFGIRRWFDLTVLGEDTVCHKPFPEPYIKALTMLDVKGSSVMVIEDSPNGIKAAKTAGCYVTGITTGFDKALLQGAGADAVAGTFEEIRSMLLSDSPG
ncbi:MAG: HAD family phosphatase [Bacteroidales bacterium]|nr:HAD family phosphatase [Bacteroidales bacterium]